MMRKFPEKICAGVLLTLLISACGGGGGTGNAGGSPGNAATSTASNSTTNTTGGGTATGLTLAGNVTTFAGSCGASGTGGVCTGMGSLNGTGTAASFNMPMGIATDKTNLYVADTRNNSIRQIAIATKVVTTLAGTTGSGSIDGTGTGAKFSNPTGIYTDGTNLYVADQWNHAIRKIVIASGVVTTLAGCGLQGNIDNANGRMACFNWPTGITSDGVNLYVTDQQNNSIRKVVIATGAVTTLAGNGTWGSTDNATGTLATFKSPYGITTDGADLFVMDGGNLNIRKINIASGAVSTLVTSGVGGTNGVVYPEGIATDSTNLYVADGKNHVIYKFDKTTGAGGKIAGSGVWGALDGTGLAATFADPGGITTDGASLFVADGNNHVIRRIQ